MENKNKPYQFVPALLFLIQRGVSLIGSKQLSEPNGQTPIYTYALKQHGVK